LIILHKSKIGIVMKPITSRAEVYGEAHNGG